MQALERRSQLQGEKSPGGLPWKIKVTYLSDQTTVHMITKCFRIESFEEESDKDEIPTGVKGQKTESDEVGSQFSRRIASLISIIVKRI